MKEASTETVPQHTEGTEPGATDSCLHCALEAAMSGDKLNQVRLTPITRQCTHLSKVPHLLMTTGSYLCNFWIRYWYVHFICYMPLLGH